ncbi:MAG: hypothetical protein C4567_14860 [Deltaproteobacteria bacterium]|nr:MAG: hypothetical protein C4567_14860 [Deltaproteobacteria bacterium]
MPVYDYRCLDCGALARRIGGIDDHMALCPRCRGVMLRLTEEVFQSCFPGESERAGPGKSINPLIFTSEDHSRG